MRIFFQQMRIFFQQTEQAMITKYIDRLLLLKLEKVIDSCKLFLKENMLSDFAFLSSN